MNSIFSNKNKLMSRIKKYSWAFVRSIIVIGICYIILYPFFTKIINGFKSYDDMIDPTVVYFPHKLSLEYIKQVIGEMDYLRSFGNTLVISLVIAVLQTAVAAVVGYGFGRFRFKGDKILFAMVIMLLMIPPQVILVPLFVSFKDFLGVFNLIDTPLPSFIMAATGIGFKNGLFIFLSKQVFAGIPKELEEAAALDGSGAFRTFYKVMLPSAKTILITVFLLSFSWQWTDVLYSNLFFRDTNILTTAVQHVGIGASMVEKDTLTNIGAILVILPLAILYMFAQRTFVETIDNSGITG